MKQTSKKHSLLFALPVLAVLVFGSIGTTSVFADADNGFIPTTVSSVTSDALSDVSMASPENRAEVIFDGETNGWAVVAGQAFPSKIVISEGHAVHQNNGVWKVKSLASISVGERTDIPLELKGKAVDGKLRLHGTGSLEGGDTFRIILRGHYAPVADSSGSFVLDFSTAKVQNMENGLRIPLFQYGLINVEPVPAVDDFVADANVEG